MLKNILSVLLRKIDRFYYKTYAFYLNYENLISKIYDLTLMTLGSVITMTEMTLIEALEKLALITKRGLDEPIHIPGNANEPITIGEAIKEIQDHASDISEIDDYIISSDGIRKTGEDGNEIVYQVIESK